MRSLLSLRTNKALVARLGEFVTLPAEEQRYRAPQGGRRPAPGRRPAAAAAAQLALARGVLRGRRRRADQARPEQDDLVVGLRRAPARRWSPGCCSAPFWVAPRDRAAARAQPRRPRQGAQGQEATSASSFPRTSTCSRRRSAPGTASRARWVSSRTRHRSRRSVSSSRVVTDEQLGIPLDEALEVTAKRMQNTDIDQVAVLALIQREAGGNTAEVLDQVTTNIRARMDIRRLVTVLTAQGKFSAVVVACVPLGIFLFLMLVNPDHLDPLFHQTARAGRGDRRDLHDARSASTSSGASSRSSSEHDPFRSHPRPVPPRHRGDDGAPGAHDACRPVHRDARADQRLRLRRDASRPRSTQGPSLRARLGDITRCDR